MYDDMIWPHKYRGYNRSSRHWKFNKKQKNKFISDELNLMYSIIGVRLMNYEELSKLYPNGHINTFEGVPIYTDPVFKLS